MTIKEVINKERWTKAVIDNCRLTPFNWRHLHNLSLDRVKKQVSAHIAELEKQVESAYKQGYDDGYSKGFAEGYNEKEQELA